MERHRKKGDLEGERKVEEKKRGRKETEGGNELEGRRKGETLKKENGKRK